MVNNGAYLGGPHSGPWQIFRSPEDEYVEPREIFRSPEDEYIWPWEIFRSPEDEYMVHTGE